MPSEIEDLQEQTEENELRSDDVEEMSNQAQEEEGIRLPPAKAMRPSEAAKILGAAPTQVIVFFGPVGSGKTTLISSIYERFAEGELENFRFAGSATLMGFERISHPSREASGRTRADTDHTPLMMSRLIYHMKVNGVVHEGLQDLLFVDVSGEEFEQIRDYSEACEVMSMIRRSDHFLVLVDGDKLSDSGLRHQARDETCTVLRRLVETGVLSSSSNVDILFSKWDLVERHLQKNTIMEFAKETQAEIFASFASVLGGIRFGEIIARAPSNSSAPAKGVEPLITSWVCDSQVPRRVARIQLSQGELGREIDRFIPAGPRHEGD